MRFAAGTKGGVKDSDETEDETRFSLGEFNGGKRYAVVKIFRRKVYVNIREYEESPTTEQEIEEEVATSQPSSSQTRPKQQRTKLPKIPAGLVRPDIPKPTGDRKDIAGPSGWSSDEEFLQCPPAPRKRKAERVSFVLACVYVCMYVCMLNI